jgi:hypothetical protein
LMFAIAFGLNTLKKRGSKFFSCTRIATLGFL